MLEKCSGAQLVVYFQSSSLLEASRIERQICRRHDWQNHRIVSRHDHVSKSSAQKALNSHAINSKSFEPHDMYTVICLADGDH